MKSPTEALKDIAHQFYLSEISKVVLGNPKFPLWSGSSKPHQHHYGKGQLAQHTMEVVELCLQNNIYLGKPIDERKLFLAALFHDAGKMWDYKPVKEIQDYHEGFTDNYDKWEGSVHKRRIHHISRSALVWNEAIVKYTGTIDEPDDVLHAILAHHGLREWGSPVMPNTQLAWMLHLCDGISARMNDANKWDMTKK